MTSIYYDTHYSEEFSKAVLALAHRDESLIERINEGPRTIGQLEFQLRVDSQARTDLVHKYAQALASTEPATVLEAAAAFTKDLEYLREKAKAHAACVAIRPAIYEPIR